jgi:hypothetical protein
MIYSRSGIQWSDISKPCDFRASTRMPLTRDLVRLNFSSLGRSFGLHQLLCARPRQVIVGGTCAGRCRPAALLQIIALLPVRGNLLQGRQVGFRVAILQEFLHADRRKGSDHGGISLFTRKFVGSAASYPAAPGKSDDYRRDSAYSYSLEKTSPRLTLQN